MWKNLEVHLRALHLCLCICVCVCDHCASVKLSGPLHQRHCQPVCSCQLQLTSAGRDSVLQSVCMCLCVFVCMCVSVGQRPRREAGEERQGEERRAAPRADASPDSPAALRRVVRVTALSSSSCHVSSQLKCDLCGVVDGSYHYWFPRSSFFREEERLLIALVFFVLCLTWRAIGRDGRLVSGCCVYLQGSGKQKALGGYTGEGSNGWGEEKSDRAQRGGGHMEDDIYFFFGGCVFLLFWYFPPFFHTGVNEISLLARIPG